MTEPVPLAHAALDGMRTEEARVGPARGPCEP